MARRTTPQPPVRLMSSRLLDVDKGVLVEPGELLANLIAVPGDSLADIGVTEHMKLVMKDGQVDRHDDAPTP